LCFIDRIISNDYSFSMTNTGDRFLSVVLRLGGVVALAVLLSGCASLVARVQPIPPEVALEEVRLTGLDFSRVDLEADISVDNPNQVAVVLNRFSWILEIEGEELLSGEQQDGLRIDAGGQSQLLVPFSFAFEEALRTADAAWGVRELDYAVRVITYLDVPVIGEVEVPLRGEGTVPIPRLPRAAVRSVHLESMGLTGAEMVLTFAVENPNVFDLTLERFDWSFFVRERAWVEGRATSRTIAAGETSEVEAAFSVRFLEVGRGIIQLLTGGLDLDYSLAIDAQVQPGHPLVPAVGFSPTIAGTIPVVRR
jgi:LEA14-like dessication related protein